MTGDNHGRTSEKATLLVRAVDEILGTHRHISQICTALVFIAIESASAH